ncbi:unnamed protein product [Camellia sinensis]
MKQISRDVAELGVFVGGSGGRGSDTGGVAEVDLAVPEAVAELPDLKLEGVREGREGERVVNLTLRCPQSFHGIITVDPQPDWTPDELFSKINLFEHKFNNASSSSPQPLTQTSS